MLSLRSDKLVNIQVPLSTLWLVGGCMEARGKQELWTRQRPEILKALREQAMIQSAESSNRIEGVTITPERLRPLLIGRSRPRDRSEEEIAGYRRAFNYVFSNAGRLEFTPRLIQRLHRLAQSGAGDAGQWKQRNNEIIEIHHDGRRRIRFVPVEPAKVPEYLENLCGNYRELLRDARVPGLLLIATAILDFLCIHPFRDGNGRVSRLLQTALLQEQGFDVARYVSLERLVEESKDDYYAILEACSHHWHAGGNQLIPWWNFTIGLVRKAYDEWGNRIELSLGTAKTDLVRIALEQLPDLFSLADVIAACPSVSLATIKKVLANQKASGALALEGRGRGAKWRRRV